VSLNISLALDIVQQFHLRRRRDDPTTLGLLPLHSTARVHKSINKIGNKKIVQGKRYARREYKVMYYD
jgi:hypothetical protein